MITVSFQDKGYTIDGEGRAEAYGRNGWMNCLGLSIEKTCHDDLISIWVNNSRGHSNSVCLIIPVYDLDKLISALTKIYDDYKGG